MKILKDTNSMRLESGYDYLSFLSCAIYCVLSVLCVIVSAHAGPYWPGMLITAAILAGFASLYFLTNRSYVLTANKNEEVVSLVSQSPFGLFKKTTRKNFNDAVELHTVRIPGEISSVAVAATDTEVLFSIRFADKTTLEFHAYRPKALEKIPFFSFKQNQSTVKTLEQDINAPKLAKFLGVSLKTQTKDKTSKSFITTPQYRDV